MKKIKLTLLILFISAPVLFPQIDTTYIHNEDIIDALIEDSREEEATPELYDILETLLQNPVDINTAGISELQRIPFLDFSIAELIINHRSKYGLFFSTSELYAIREIPKDLTRQIIPFVSVSPAEQPVAEETVKEKNFLDGIRSSSKIYLRSRTVNDIQTRKGFAENRFAGSKPGIYNRMQIKYDNNFRIGLLSEKDPGEREFNDFTSFHLYANDLGMVKNAVLGDYILEFGQGLALWNLYGFSKGSDAINPVKKKDRKIVPYTSATENNFFRGAAATLDLNPFQVSAFYSKNKLDANIDPETGMIISTPIDGLHRTEGEISRRKTAEETFYGARADYTLRNTLKVGLLHYRSSFSHPFAQSSVYGRSGKDFNYTSAAYDFFLTSLNFFGEVTYNGTSFAAINGLQFSFRRELLFISSVRNYPVNFINLHGFAFGERSGAGRNEFGIYNGLRWRMFLGVLNFYYDQFKFPYASSDSPLPAVGNEIFAELTSKPFTRVETRFRYKREKKEIDLNINDENLIVNRIRQSIRGEVLYDISRNLRWRSRFEYSNFNINSAETNEHGFLVFQDLRVIPNSELNIYGRIIFFRTDSFSSAVYEYENSLTGQLTNLAMFGEGIRWYVLVRYRLLSFLTLSCKYSETYKPKESTISSGNLEIDGNLDNRINLQIDVAL
jgi:hypothetical protein